MSKQPSPLEALKNLMKNYYEMCLDTGNNDDEYQRNNLTSEYHVIEKALKKYAYIDENKVYIVEKKQYEKQFKALEIIMKLGKPKVFELQGQWYISNGDVFIHSHNIPITKEQAQLLLEVLECQKQ